MKTINNYASLVKEKHALNKTIAPVETDLTDASQDYAIGQNFIYDGGLYKAKTAIAQHDALVLNTNYEAADDIVSQIAGKQDPITVDNVPTENSDNPVKSGGVFSAEANIYEVMGRNGAKNLVPYPYYNGDSWETNGIAFTVNSDGSVTASGTASADAYFRCTYTTGNKHIALSADTDYILNGTGNAAVAVILRNSGGSNVASGRATDATYSCTTAGDYDVILLVDNGTDLTTPLTIYPMLRYASDSDDTYQPYAKTNAELTAENQTLTQKAYLTDDATETALASDDVFPFYDTSATAKKKMTVQKMAEQLISNPNLLDNPWFTINQRGLSTYNGTGIYTVDRWKISRNTHNVIVNSDYVSLVRVGSGYNPTFEETIEGIRPGKYTVSVKYRTTKVSSSDAQSGYKINVGAYLGEWLPTSADWNILSKTVNIPSDFTGNLAISIQDLNTSKGTSATDDQIDIACVKIELGEISTLAMDTAPNYATELLKCQRYFQTIPQGCKWRIAQYNVDAVPITVSLPVEMRAKPTVSNGTLALVKLDVSASVNVDSVEIPTQSSYGHIVLVGNKTAHGYTDGQLRVVNADLWLSADL